MKDFFCLAEKNTNVKTEVLAGFTTFFTMAYIIFVNPNMLAETGMSWHGVFVATCLAAAVGTLIMALVANVPYAVAPGMGLNALFTYTICLAGGFVWQEALAMVFICGLINIIITVTKLRKAIVKSIPEGLQNAIGGGIGLFIAYLSPLVLAVISHYEPALLEYYVTSFRVHVPYTLLIMMLLASLFVSFISVSVSLRRREGTELF